MSGNPRRNTGGSLVPPGAKAQVPGPGTSRQQIPPQKHKSLAQDQLSFTLRESCMRSDRYNRAAQPAPVRYGHRVKPRAMLLESIDHALKMLMTLVAASPHIS